MLNEMLILQQKFSERIVKNYPKYRNMTKLERLKGLSNFLIDEVLELKNELGYMYNDEKKWWKKNINYFKVTEEFIDIVHVVLQMAIELDLDADDIFGIYEHKMEENNKRQDNEY